MELAPLLAIMPLFIVVIVGLDPAVMGPLVIMPLVIMGRDMGLPPFMAAMPVV